MRTTTTGAEQRQAARVPLSVFVNQEFADEDQRLGMTTDLSLRGMSVVTLARSEDDTQRHAWVRFWLPGSEILIHALAEVIRREKDEEVERFGLRFKYLFPDQKELLAGYLAGTPTAAAATV